MGSRGAFVDVNINDFTFRLGGQNYFSLGTLSSNENVKVLVQTSGAVKAPEYSHTENRIYAIIQKGILKHVTYYDKDHNQAISIDLTIPHDHILPHKHIYLDHKTAYPISEAESKLIAKIKKEYHLK
jgi:hypothetical protein